MVQTLIKHRDERDLFEVELGRRLAGGETLSAVESVRVAYNRGLQWQDVTVDFVNTATIIRVGGDRTVQFELVAAANANTQDVGEYAINVRARTSRNRLIAATVPLFIIRVGT